MFILQINYYPRFFNLSASRKRRGGLYAGSENLSREYAPSSGATPRCLHRTLYYGLFNSLLQKLIRQRSALAFLVVQKLDDQDRLTEVSHSVDGGIFQALRWFVLSMCYSIDTTSGHVCDRSSANSLAGLWMLASFLYCHSTTETLN